MDRLTLPLVRRRNRDITGLAVVAVFVFALPFAVADDGTLRLFILAGTYVVIATGLQMCFGYAGLLNLGIPAFAAVGAYTYAILGRDGTNPWVAVLCAVLAAALVAAVLGVLVLRLRALYFAIAAFGLVLIADNIISAWTDVTDGAEGMIGVPQLSLGDLLLGSTEGTYYLMWAFAIAVLLLSLLVRHSAYGRSVLAVRDSEVASAAFGVPVRRRLLEMFVLSGAVAGLGGALYAHDITVISPKAFGVELLLLVTVVVVVGGKDTIWGVLVGAAAVVLLQNEILPAVFASGNIELVVFGGILVVAMILAPTGVVGLIREAVQLASSRVGRGRRAEPAGEPSRETEESHA